MHSMAKDKYNFIRADQLRKQEEGLSLMDDDNLPILPQWNDELTLPPSFEADQESVQDDKRLKEYSIKDDLPVNDVKENDE